MPNSLENQFIADTFKALLHTGNVSLSSGSPKATIYSGDGFESSLSISTASNGIDVSGNAIINGDITSFGNGFFYGSLSSGDLTVSGNSNVIGSLNSGDLTVSGNSNVSGLLNSSGLVVNGNSSVIGNSNISNNVTVGGVLNSGNLTVNGNSNVSGSLSSRGLTVSGSSNIIGSLSSNIIYAGQYLNLPRTDSRADIVNHIYPIGSIFLSFSNTNPSTRFAGTTWIQISQGRFIVGVGGGNDGTINRTFTAGNNSGKYEHQLTIAEMPSHNHVVPNIGGAESDSGTGGTESPVNGINGTSGSTGENRAHENTPPGFGLYIWRRES